MIRASIASGSLLEIITGLWSLTLMYSFIAFFGECGTRSPYPPLKFPKTLAAFSSKYLFCTAA